MKVTDIFRPPFRADGAYIYSADDVMSLMAANCRNYPREMMDRVVQILNGESKPKGTSDIGVNGSEICVNGDPLLTVRGWSHLTNPTGLNLPSEEADKIQYELAVWVVSKLRGEQ